MRARGGPPGTAGTGLGTAVTSSHAAGAGTRSPLLPPRGARPRALLLAQCHHPAGAARAQPAPKTPIPEGFVTPGRRARGGHRCRPRGGCERGVTALLEAPRPCARRRVLPSAGGAAAGARGTGSLAPRDGDAGPRPAASQISSPPASGWRRGDVPESRRPRPRRCPAACAAMPGSLRGDARQPPR